MAEIVFICGYRAFKMWAVQLTNRISRKTELQFNSHRRTVARVPDSTDMIWMSTVGIFSTTAMSPNDLTH